MLLFCILHCCAFIVIIHLILRKLDVIRLSVTTSLILVIVFVRTSPYIAIKNFDFVETEVVGNCIILLD